MSRQYPPNPARERAQELARKVASMSDAERAALAEKLPTVLNPQQHPLSVKNTLGLYMQSQRTDLTIVAGFRQWIDAGRVVKKGESAAGYINVPIHVVPKNNREADGTPKEGAEKALRFRLVAVFDISQTEALNGAPAQGGTHE